MSARFPAIEMLRRFPDVSISDPIHRAAMYEARARDCLADASAHDRAGFPIAADVCRAAFDRDMEEARTILEAAAGAEEHTHAA